MSLLALECVSRCHRHRAGRHEVLRDVSLRLEEGEIVAVWGLPRSGRSTLMRVAAGIEPPDSGEVRLHGHDLTGDGGALGQGIGYCQQVLRDVEAQGVLDALIVGQLAQGTPKASARAQALAMLVRVGAERCAAHELYELSGTDALRVALARALVSKPSLLVIDEPLKGVNPLDRHTILALLRSLAEEGTAILMSTGDATGLSAADRALALAEGELRGALAAQLAPVVELRSARSA
jgi:ABC-type multidrug transport system ATPase subunit